jgi:hypothetical protein
LPAAWAYGFSTLGCGIWALMTDWPVQVFGVLITGGLSILHYALTGGVLLSKRSFKPTAALDEWQLLGADEREVREVRLLTRITGGLSAAFCLLMFAAILLGLFDFRPAMRVAVRLGLAFWPAMLIAFLALIFNGLTLAFILKAWKTKYFD